MMSFWATTPLGWSPARLKALPTDGPPSFSLRQSRAVGYLVRISLGNAPRGKANPLMSSFLLE